MRDHFGEIVQQKLSDVVHRTGTVTEGGSRQSFSLVKGVSRDSNVGVARQQSTNFQGKVMKSPMIVDKYADDGSNSDDQAQDDNNTDELNENF